MSKKTFKKNGKEIGVIGTFFKNYDDALLLYQKKRRQKKDYFIVKSPVGYLVVSGRGF